MLSFLEKNDTATVHLFLNACAHSFSSLGGGRPAGADGRDREGSAAVQGASRALCLDHAAPGLPAQHPLQEKPLLIQERVCSYVSV